MSLINTLSLMHYTAMANNAAYSMMKISNARMNLLNETAGSIGACSPEQLCELDTQLELDAIATSMQYKMACAMAEQLKKQQSEDAKRFSTFA